MGRRFTPVLHHMLSHMFACDTPHQKLRRDCVGCLAKIYELLANWEAGGGGRRLADLARAHLIQYKELRDLQPDGSMCWQLFPKHHLFCHCCEGSRGNPALEWCYADESAIGNGSKPCQSCHPLYICTHLMQKYRLAFEAPKP